ncbi:MAG: hydroxyisourate hydrolase [Hyphomicrobiaceae bacterium]
MATLSSHTLSSVDGTHAGGVAITVLRIDQDGTRTAILEASTDDGGRFCETIDLGDASADSRYEMVLQTSAYFSTRGIPQSGTQIVDDIVIRFRMPDPEGRYHIPLIIGPNGYSAWWSS